jgi:hypothetical protein
MSKDAPDGIDGLKRLAQDMRRPLKNLIVLDSDNDPFTAERRSRRICAEWIANLYAEFEIRPGSHVRRIFYMLVSQAEPILLPSGKPFENTLECWDDLCTAVRDARYLGLIPASSIVDRRNPEPAINFAASQEYPAEIDISEGGIHKSTFGQYFAPSLTLPELGLTRPFVAQRYHVEIWCEKSTMNDVLLPLGRRYGINIVTGVGEMSATACENLVNRARESECPVRILYVSDFDPAGRSMPVAAARKIEFFARETDLDIQVNPVVLTPEQCVEYRLPRTPIKRSELRAAKFEARFGAGATELDALEALHPGTLLEILIEQIERYIDVDLDHNVRQVADEAERDLSARTANVHLRHANEINALSQTRAEIEAVAERALETARAQIAAMERGFAEQARPVLEAIRADLEAERTDPEEYNWPDCAEGDEIADPLFDSTRSYLDQVDRYRKHQGKPEETTLWHLRRFNLICEECGKQFTAARQTATVCSRKCTHARFRRRKREHR